MTGDSNVSKQKYDQVKELYRDMARRARRASKPGHTSVGEPGNDGPEVKRLIQCAEDLAKNYKPSGAISIVEVD
jgi:hypothetical protein